MTTGYDSLTVNIGFGTDPLDLPLSYTYSATASGTLQSFTTTRGKSGPLDEYQSGTATIVLRNQDYVLDPANSTGPFFTQFVPFTPVQITANNSSGTTYPIFTGYTTSINPFVVTYGADGRAAYLTVNCTDFFTFADACILPAIDTGIEPQKFGGLYSGEQLYQVVHDYYFAALGLFSGAMPGHDAFGAGKTPRGNTLVAPYKGGQSLLAYAQQLARTEGGAFFVDPSGLATYHDRYRVLADTAYSTSQATFDDVGAGIRYRDYQKDNGSVFFNTVTGGFGPSLTYTKTNRTATQPIVTYDIGNLFFNDMAEVIARCDWYLNRYGLPFPSPNQLTIDPRRGNGQLNTIALDLREQVTVKRKPPGATAQETTSVAIRSIAHQMNTSSKSWSITYGFEPLQYTFASWSSYAQWDGSSHWNGTKHWAA